MICGVINGGCEAFTRRAQLVIQYDANDEKIQQK